MCRMSGTTECRRPFLQCLRECADTSRRWNSAQSTLRLLAPLGSTLAAPAAQVGHAGPCKPTGPAGPARPWGPVAPCGPGGPVNPCGPCGPTSPCGPSTPWEPGGPSLPASPCGAGGVNATCREISASARAANSLSDGPLQLSGVSGSPSMKQPLRLGWTIETDWREGEYGEDAKRQALLSLEPASTQKADNPSRNSGNYP